MIWSSIKVDGFVKSSAVSLANDMKVEIDSLNNHLLTIILKMLKFCLRSENVSRPIMYMPLPTMRTIAKID